MDATALPPWLQALLRRESGGNWGIVNDGGYSGGFQFGEGAARDSGTYSGDGDLTDNRFGGTFRGPNGETLTYDQWLASPDAQLATMGGWTQSLDRQIRARGLDQYVGQTVNGVPVTMEGLYTGAHLGGVGGLSSWLRGTGNPADGNGTRVGDYVAMGSGSGGGTPAPALAALAPAAGGQDMATGGLLGVAPAAPALQQSWLGGLLGVEPSEEQGLLGQIVNPQNSSDRQAIMQMAAAMLQASGPSTEPRSFGTSLGAGLQGYAAGQEFGAKQDERKIAQQTRMQVEAAIAALPPEQQAWARANPAAFSELMLKNQLGAPETRTINRGDQEVTQQYDAVTRGWTDVGSAPRWNPATGLDNTPYTAVGSTGVLDTRTGTVAPIEGMGGGVFTGSSVDAQALNWAVANGRMTQDQANDWALGHQVVQGNNVYWVTPGMVYGDGPAATAPMPEGMGGGTTAPAAGAPASPPGVPGAPVAAGTPPAAGATAGQPAPFLTTPYRPTEVENKTRGFADRMTIAAPIIDEFEQSGLDFGNVAADQMVGGLAGSFLTSDAYKRFRTAGEAWISGLQRLDSGAVTPPEELARYWHTYMPEPNDPPELLAEKRERRRQAELSMIAGAGQGYTPPSSAPDAGSSPAAGGAAPPAAAGAPLPPPTGTPLNTAPSGAAPAGSYPAPTTAAERDALAPGTIYRAPDGSLRVRP